MPTTTVVKGAYWFDSSCFPVSEIDSTLFTHLFCAFAVLNPTTFQLTISPECTTFTQTVQQRNPMVKTLLSIGGASADSQAYSRMASQANSRTAFINSAINLARANGFHGLDLDWECLATAADMENLAALLTQFRTAINVHHSGCRAPLLLTAALPGTPQQGEAAAFPARVIAETVDWVNVMCYDFYSPTWYPNETKSHSALHNPIMGESSASSGIKAWINAGVPSKKLVLGFPYYGRAWRLKNPNDHGLNAPASGIDNSVGTDPGVLTYSEINQFINRGGRVVYDTVYKTNYCYSGKTWISYDGTDSISDKILYAKNNALLGYFAWSVSQDPNSALSTRASQVWDQN